MFFCFQNVYHHKLCYVYNSMYAKSIPFKWCKPFGELTSIKIPSRHWKSTLHGQFQNWNVPDVGHQTSQGVGTSELTRNLAMRNPTLSLHEFPHVFWNGTQPFTLPFILTLKSPWGVPDYTKDPLENIRWYKFSWQRIDSHWFHNESPSGVISRWFAGGGPAQ